MELIYFRTKVLSDDSDKRKSQIIERLKGRAGFLSTPGFAPIAVAPPPPVVPGGVIPKPTETWETPFLTPVGFDVSASSAIDCLRGKMRFDAFCDSTLAVAALIKGSLSEFKRHLVDVSVKDICPGADLPKLSDMVIASMNANSVDRTKILTNATSLCGGGDVDSLSVKLMAMQLQDGPEAGQDIYEAQQEIRHVLERHSIVLPNGLENILASANTSVYEKAYSVGIALSANLESLGCQDAEEPKVCRAGFDFLNALLSFAISQQNADSKATQDEAKQAFKDAAVEFVSQVAVAGAGIERGARWSFVFFLHGDFWEKLLLPQLKLGYNLSLGYVNRDGGTGPRFVASAPTFGWFHSGYYTDRVYLGAYLYLVDLAGPFAEGALRANATYNNDEYLAYLFIHPQCGINVGIPWLSKHILATTTFGYRLVSPVKASTVDATIKEDYVYEKPFQKNWYKGFELGIGLSFIL